MKKLAGYKVALDNIEVNAREAKVSDKTVENVRRNYQKNSDYYKRVDNRQHGGEYHGLLVLTALIEYELTPSLPPVPLGEQSYSVDEVVENKIADKRVHSKAPDIFVENQLLCIEAGNFSGNADSEKRLKKLVREFIIRNFHPCCTLAWFPKSIYNQDLFEREGKLKLAEGTYREFRVEEANFHFKASRGSDLVENLDFVSTNNAR